MTIRIECSGAGVLPLDDLEDFQGGLKKRTDQDIDSIVRSIEQFGFSFPFFVWKDGGRNRCMDGHGRIRALLNMRQHGAQVPDLPVVYIEASSEAEARQKLLRLNSQYGEMTLGSVTEFMDGLDIAWDDLALPASSYIRPADNGDPKMDTDFKYLEQYAVVVTCKDEADQASVYEALSGQGYPCKVIAV